jgi:hypothetical protein
MPANTTSLQGTVRDPQTRLAIPGVKISLLRAGAVVSEKWTDAEGIFRFVDLTPATYELRAEKQGFQNLDLPSLQIKGPEIRNLVLEAIAGATMPVPMKGPSGVPGAAPSPPAPPLFADWTLSRSANLPSASRAAGNRSRAGAPGLRELREGARPLGCSNAGLGPLRQRR